MLNLVGDCFVNMHVHVHVLLVLEIQRPVEKKRLRKFIQSKMTPNILWKAAYLWRGLVAQIWNSVNFIARGSRSKQTSTASEKLRPADNCNRNLSPRASPYRETQVYSGLPERSEIVRLLQSHNLGPFRQSGINRFSARKGPRRHIIDAELWR